MPVGFATLFATRISRQSGRRAAIGPASNCLAIRASAAKRQHSCTIMRSAPPWSLTSVARMSRYRGAAIYRPSTPGRMSQPFETHDLAVGFRAATSAFPARI